MPQESKIKQNHNQRKQSKEATMEGTTWEQKLHAITHIFTSPTTNPSLSSQFFIGTQIPCYLHWDYYPPILCKHPSNIIHLRWAFSHFLKRLSGLGQPQAYWRTKCPYLQPPPLVLAKGVEEAKWGDEEKKAYVRQRLRRKKLEVDVNPLIPVLVPNILLFSLMLWNPFPDGD